MSRNQRDEPTDTINVTNFTDDNSLNCNQNDTLLTSDNLGTLIKALQGMGLIGGSTS